MKISNKCKECIYHKTAWNILNFNNETDYCQIHQTEFANIRENDIKFCKEFKTKYDTMNEIYKYIVDKW